MFNPRHFIVENTQMYNKIIKKKKNSFIVTSGHIVSGTKQWTHTWTFAFNGSASCKLG